MKDLSLQVNIIEAVILYKNGILMDFAIEYHVLDSRTSARLSNFELVKQCLNADSIRIQIQDDNRNIFLPTGSPGSMWTDKEETISIQHPHPQRIQQLLHCEICYRERQNVCRKCE